MSTSEINNYDLLSSEHDIAFNSIENSNKALKDFMRSLNRSRDYFSKAEDRNFVMSRNDEINFYDMKPNNDRFSECSSGTNLHLSNNNFLSGIKRFQKSEKMELGMTTNLENNLNKLTQNIKLQNRLQVASFDKSKSCQTYGKADLELKEFGCKIDFEDYLNAGNLISEDSDGLEVKESDLSSNPFFDESCEIKKEKKMPIINYHWTLEKKIEDNKSRSVPVSAQRHLMDFWKDFGNGEIHSLPTIGAGRSDSIQRIDSSVVKDLLDGKYNIDYCIVDCRFSYEYKGGHIKNSINIKNSEKSFDLFKNPKALIFHCEFSSHRAPKMAQFIRNYDRSENVYPNLTIPEIYILQGGYKEFFKSYPDYCTPSNYITMNDVNYKEQFFREVAGTINKK